MTHESSIGWELSHSTLDYNSTATEKGKGSFPCNVTILRGRAGTFGDGVCMSRGRRRRRVLGEGGHSAPYLNMMIMIPRDITSLHIRLADLPARGKRPFRLHASQPPRR